MTAMLIKVCGVGGPAAERDVELLAAAGVDLVGLWHGVPGGHADLRRDELARVAAGARAHGLEPVLVTFGHDGAALARSARASGATWVQLHAYQLPRVVAELKRSLRGLDVRVMKVLHVRDQRCVDLRLADAYVRAGVDAFVLDVATAAGRVGSTGESIAPAVAARVADRLGRPFVLAGGIGAAASERHADLMLRPGFAGIDVDSGARDDDGRLQRGRIAAIVEAWRGAAPREERHVQLR